MAAAEGLEADAYGRSAGLQAFETEEPQLLLVPFRRLPYSLRFRAQGSGL